MAEANPEKKPERLLCVPSDGWKGMGGFYLYHSPAVLQEAWKDAVAIDRTARLESDPRWLQLATYAVVEGPEGFLVYRRKGGDKRLGGKLSIGWGGHVNDQDVIPYHRLSDAEPLEYYLDFIQDSFENAIMRELEEELAIPWESFYVEFKGLLFVDEPGIEQHHLGLVYHARVEDGILIHSMGGDEVIVGWMTDHELQVDMRRSNYEAWSRELIRSYLPLVEDFATAVEKGPKLTPPGDVKNNLSNTKKGK